jgi:ribose transport system substrate-binding protein
MMDAKQKFVPFGGETENGFRKFCAKYAEQGLKCTSAGSGPAQVAVAIKTAIAALEGKVIPQEIKLPLAVASYPDMKAGQDYFPDQSDNFFVGNSFPTCGINFTAQEIMSQTKENQ